MYGSSSPINKITPTVDLDIISEFGRYKFDSTNQYLTKVLKVFRSTNWEHFKTLGTSIIYIPKFHTFSYAVYEQNCPFYMFY